MTCGISAAGEVEQDFGPARRGERGVILKCDGHGLKMKEKQAEARRGLRGRASFWPPVAVIRKYWIPDCLAASGACEALDFAREWANKGMTELGAWGGEKSKFVYDSVVTSGNLFCC